MQRFETAPPYVRPKDSAIDEAIPAVWKALQEHQLDQARVVRIRADLLAKSVFEAGFGKSVSYWAIQTLLETGELVAVLIKWGGVIPNDSSGVSVSVPSWKDLPWNSDTYKPSRLKWDQFLVEWEPLSVTTAERLSKDEWTLGEIRVLLNAHYHRNDRQGFSPVADIVEAVEVKIEGLRVAAVKCGIVQSGEPLRVKNSDDPHGNNCADDIDRIELRLMELGKAKTRTEARRLTIDAVVERLELSSGSDDNVAPIKPYRWPNELAQDKWIYERIHKTSHDDLSVEYEIECQNRGWRCTVKSRNAFKNRSERYSEHHRLAVRNFSGEGPVSGVTDTQ